MQYGVYCGIQKAREALVDAKDGGCSMEFIAGFKKLEKTRLALTLLEQEAWRA